jgi:4-diphosphocytidyl-2-C-methyl-D-erythritol kinase
MALRALHDVAAPAKINLFLHVVGRRADGYHLLQSAVALIDWCDTLHFERRGDGRLERHDLGDALPPDDLCLRAARALKAASGTPWGADISVDKSIPAGAGMGGGSSDAASTLLALNRLWALDWPKERLAALALTLGADVPFFIGGGHALMEGIGERLTPIALARQRVAIVKPAASLETRAIFASPLLMRSPETDIVAGFTADSLLARGHTDFGFGRNDLQAAAEAQSDEVSQALRLLESCYGNARMTGSGSAVFARVDDEAKPPAALPESWAFRLCRTLERHPLHNWAGPCGREGFRGAAPQGAGPV